jgi:PHS family inorganic phosphate transporter-like MFS transporter
MSSEIDYAEKLSPAKLQVSPDERRRAALREIDEASFSWFHAKACLVAGVGL